MSSFKKNLFLKFSIIFTSILLLFFNNCSGNGGGYAGLTIEGPNSMKKGETVTVKVSGGTPPYQLSTSSYEVTIVETSNEGEFTVTLSATFDELDFSLRAEDALGKTASKSITIYTFEIMEMSYPDIKRASGRITSIGLNDKISVLNAVDYYNIQYGTHLLGIFGFSHQNNVIEKFGEPLIQLQDLRHAGDIIDLDNNHLIVGNSGRRFEGKLGVGSITIFKVKEAEFALTDYIVSPTKHEYDFFGESISIHGDTIAVGSPGLGETNKGAVYIYSLENGVTTLVKSLSPPDVNHIKFGLYVRHYGEFLYIGSLLKTDSDIRNTNLLPKVIHAYKRIGGDWVFQESLNLDAEARQLGFKEGIVYCNGFEASGEVLIANCQHIMTETSLRNHVSLVFKWQNGQLRFIQTISSGKSTSYKLFAYLSPWPVAIHENLFATEVINPSNNSAVFHIFKWNENTNKYGLFREIPMPNLKGVGLGQQRHIDVFGHKFLVTGETLNRTMGFLVDLNEL